MYNILQNFPACVQFELSLDVRRIIGLCATSHKEMLFACKVARSFSFRSSSFFVLVFFEVSDCFHKPI